MEEQEEVKEILDRLVRMVDIHRPDRGLSIPRPAQALMQGQRFIERRDDQESHAASKRTAAWRFVQRRHSTHTELHVTRFCTVLNKLVISQIRHLQ